MKYVDNAIFVAHGPKWSGWCVCLMALMALFGGCATVIIPSPSPPPVDTITTPLRTESSVFLPIAIDLDTMRQRANRLLPFGQLHTGYQKQGNAREYWYTVYRDEDMTFEFSDAVFTIGFPLRIEVRGNFTSCDGQWVDGECLQMPRTTGDTAVEQGNTTVASRIDMAFQIALTPDYTIRTTVDPDLAMVDDLRLSIDFNTSLIRITIDISDEIENVFRPFHAALQNLIEESLGRNVANDTIRNGARAYWDTFSQPIAAGDSWVLFSPQRVLFTGFRADDRRLYIDLGLVGDVRVSRAEPTSSAAELPPWETSTPSESVVEVRFPLYSIFDDVVQTFDDMLIGRRFEERYRWVQIIDTNISATNIGDRNLLLLEIRFFGEKAPEQRISGRLYFLATPVYNAADRTIVLRDFRMTPETSNVLLSKELTWVAEMDFNAGPTALRYETGPLIDEIEVAIQDALDSGIAIGTVVVSGEIDTIEFDGFYADEDDGIEAYVHARGRPKLRLSTPQ